MKIRLKDLQRRDNAACQAYNLFQDNFLILATSCRPSVSDFELAGLALIDRAGRILLNERIHPIEKISSEVMPNLEIASEDEIKTRYFPDIWKLLKYELRENLIVIYNAEIQKVLLNHGVVKHSLETVDFCAVCAMHLYSKWVNEYSNSVLGYKYQSLPDSDHTPLGDCRATLKILNMMCKWRTEQGSRLF